MLNALITFSAAERLGLSGVMSLFFCAIVMRHYTFYNLCRRSQASARILFTTISELCETVGFACCEWDARACE